MVDEKKEAAVKGPDAGKDAKPAEVTPRPEGVQESEAHVADLKARQGEDQAAFAQRVEDARRDQQKKVDEEKRNIEKQKAELLDKIQIRLKVYDGRESNIPLSDPYWDLIKVYRTLNLNV